MHVQKILVISEEIVNINNAIAVESKVLLAELLAMDEAARKHSLIKGALYRDQFASSLFIFNASLQSINKLVAKSSAIPLVFTDFNKEYAIFANQVKQAATRESDEILWVDKGTVSRWLAMLDQFRNINQASIDNSLIQIHQLTLEATRNGLFGLVLSICISFFNVWYISGSIVTPLRQLTKGMRNLLKGGDQVRISASASREFQDLAAAYNEMHAELSEQESLKADFIATLSHEIRTPLSSIQESVNLLTEEVLGDINDRQRKFLVIAASELERINGLLHQLMDVSVLVPAGHEEKSVNLLDPRRMVLDGIASLNGFASQKSITVSARCQTHCGLIRGNPEEMHQVLVNILGNAIKFSPAGGTITVTVSKNMRLAQVVFAVSDQGPGILDNETSLIFKKYYRGTAVRQHMNGIGLGLYLARQIIWNMGGDVAVANNTPDAGCTFTITIPSV